MHLMALKLQSPTPARHQCALPHLVDSKELAAQFGLSLRNVRRLVSERRIPHYKVGRLIRFDVDEIVTWLDAARLPGDEAPR